MSSAVAERTASVGVVIMTPDQMETATLADLEAVVDRNLDAFIEAGHALRAIRDRKLYRQTHATFEAYCADRFDMSRPRAYEAMAVAEVMEQMSDMPDISLPANPRQAAALAPVRGDRKKLHAAAKKVQDEKGDDATAADYSMSAAEQLGRSGKKVGSAQEAKAVSPTRKADLIVNQDIPPDQEDAVLGFGDVAGEDLGVQDGPDVSQERYPSRAGQTRCEWCGDYYPSASACPCGGAPADASLTDRAAPDDDRDVAPPVAVVAAETGAPRPTADPAPTVTPPADDASPEGQLARYLAGVDAGLALAEMDMTAYMPLLTVGQHGPMRRKHAILRKWLADLDYQIFLAERRATQGAA